MYIEIGSAADFIVNLLKAQRKVLELNDFQLTVFRSKLCNLLVLRYQDHWFPERPFKGSGYRCIRINGKMDPIIIQAGQAMGLTVTTIRRLLPSELTMWIDPDEVSYRIGENGSICVLFERPPLEAGYVVQTPPPMSVQTPPPCQSPDLYLDPRQYEQINMMYGCVGVHC